MGLGFLFWAMVLALVQVGQGALILDHDVDGLGVAGDVVLDQIVPYHLGFGLQVMEPKGNQTVMVLASAQLGEVCSLFCDGKIDEVLQMFKGADVLVYGDDLSCAKYKQLGIEYEREYHKLWCSVVPVVVSIGHWYPGIFPNFKLAADAQFMKWVRAGHPCYWLSGSDNEILTNFIATSSESLWLQGTVGIDPNRMDEIFNSVPIQLLLRGVLPILYLWSMAQALKGIRIRMKEKKATKSFMSILIANAIQGFLLGFGTFVGLYFSSNILPPFVHVLTISCFFGFSVATDLLFASILANVRRGMHSKRIRQTDSRVTLGFGGFLGVLDLVTLIYFSVTQTPTARFLVTVVMPGILTIIGFITTMNLTYQVRKLTKMLIADEFAGVKVIPALVRLANTYIYWTRVAIFSVVLTYASLLMVCLGLWTSSPGGFLITALLANLGKIFNMTSQTKCCSLPSTKSRVTTTSRIQSRGKTSNKSSSNTTGATVTSSATSDGKRT